MVIEQLRSIVQALQAHIPDLSPSVVWRVSVDEEIHAAAIEAYSGWSPTQIPFALAVKSGLYLWNGSLNQSHTISQGIMNSTGSYWHGIMHRMEPDYSNSAYWFRRIGAHPIFSELLKRTQKLIAALAPAEQVKAEQMKRYVDQLVRQSAWDPFLFIEMVEAQETRLHDSQSNDLLRQIQLVEMKLLLNYSFDQSFGGLVIDF